VLPPRASFRQAARNLAWRNRGQTAPCGSRCCPWNEGGGKFIRQRQLPRLWAILSTKSSVRGESETSQGNAVSGKTNSAVPEDLRGRSKGTIRALTVSLSDQNLSAPRSLAQRSRGPKVRGPEVRRTRASLSQVSHFLALDKSGRKDY
jgi:hypothetical protein